MRLWYRPDEFAREFNISRRTVYRLIGQNKLQSRIVGGVIRIPRQEFCRICGGARGCKPCQGKGE